MIKKFRSTNVWIYKLLVTTNNIWNKYIRELILSSFLSVLRIQTLLIQIRILLLTVIRIWVRILLINFIRIRVRLIDMDLDPNRFKWVNVPQTVGTFHTY